MDKKVFSKREALGFGWKITKENFWFFFALLIVIVLVGFFPEIVRVTLEERRFLILAHIIALILLLILDMGFVKICLKFYDQEKPRFSDLFSQYPLFFKMLFGLIFYTLIVIFGKILLIIPGIVFAIRFYLFYYFIIDKGLGPIAALKESWRATRGVGWNLFAFLLLIGIINLLGALAFLIGLFLTIPITMVATVFVYRKLLAQSETVNAG